MLQETVKINSTCESELYKEHLCYIISQGFHLTDEREYNALLEDAKYVCERCHRTTKSDANLCVPIPL